MNLFETKRILHILFSFVHFFYKNQNSYTGPFRYRISAINGVLIFKKI